MMSYWVSFVRDGNPRASGNPPWPRFTAQDRGYLDIDDRPAAARDLHPAAFAFADALIAKRREQGQGWRLDIGFAAFPSPSNQGSNIDEPVRGRQPAQ
jgi:para-nitrobenzyl esterase